MSSRNRSRRRTAQLAATALAAALGGGCAGDSPFYRDIGPPKQAPPVQGSGSNFAAPSFGDPPPTYTEKMAAKFKSSAAAVADALTIKPKVIPADDPTKLDSNLGRVTPEILIRTATMSESAGNLAAAAENLEKAREMAPQDPIVLVSCARFYLRQGDSERAMGLYQEARVAGPDRAIVWNDLGLCHVERGEWPQAQAALQRAVALQPREPRYRTNLANVLIDLGRPELAVEQLRAVRPEAVAWYQVGAGLVERGDNPRAAEFLTIAVQRDSNLAPARELLAQLEPTAHQTVANVTESPRKLPATR